MRSRIANHGVGQVPDWLRHRFSMSIPTPRRATSLPYTGSPPRPAAERGPGDAKCATLEVTLTRLGEDGQKGAKLASAEPGTITIFGPTR